MEPRMSRAGLLMVENASARGPWGDPALVLGDGRVVPVVDRLDVPVAEDRPAPGLGFQVQAGVVASRLVGPGGEGGSMVSPGVDLETDRP
jgi:hypothetical protein